MEAADAELVRAIAAGADDAPAAEAELCRRFAPRIRLYGLRHLRDEDRAADLVQAVLLALLQAARAGRIADPERVDRFMLGTSRNVAARMRETDGRSAGDAALSAIAAPDEPLERAWRRIITPAAKFWICKRALEFTGECMEVWGGNGYVETGPMARLYREAPVNSIWEGSGNVMCLDVLRAVEREAEGFLLLLDELDQTSHAHAGLQVLIGALRNDLHMPSEQREMQARRFVQRLVLAAQSGLMLRHAPASIADAFVSSRVDAECGRVYGTLAAAELHQQILGRAWPA